MTYQRTSGYIPSYLNRIRGVLGVASIWTTDPTTLANATDNDWSTATGIGSKNLVGDADFGRIIWDLGAIFNLDVRAKISIGNTIGGGAIDSVQLSGSEDGGTYYDSYGGSYENIVQHYVANTDYILFTHGFVRGRYVRMTFHGSAAGTHHGVVYEIQCVDLW